MRHRSSRLWLAVSMVVGLTLASGAPVLGAQPPDFIREVDACYDPNTDIGCQFVSVRAVGLGATGDVYVADSANERVQRRSSSGAPISHWGPSGTGWSFQGVAGLAIDPDGSVLVLGNDNIQRFSASGAFLERFESAAIGYSAAAIAVGSDRTIHVARPSGILKLDADGAYLDEWAVAFGAFGPKGLAVGSAGDVYVSDPSNDRILRYSKDGSLIDAWDAAGDGAGELDEPWGLAAGPGGDIHVADAGNNRVQRFTRTGTFVLAWGATGNGAGKWTYGPRAIVVRSHDVVVGDDGVRLQLFRYPTVIQPDGRVRIGTRGAFRGDDVYNRTGKQQTSSGTAKVGKSITFTVSIQNDGSRNDRFILKGGGSTQRFSVVYRSGSSVIGAAVRAGTYRTRSLAPGASQLITVVVTVKPGAAPGSRLDTLVTATSIADGSRRDSVRIIAERR